MTLHLLARPHHPATPASAMVWKMLFDRQQALLHRRASPAFAAGVAALGLRRDEVPHFGRLSQLVHQRTGWTLRSLGGPLPEADYYAALARRELPLVTRLRTFAEFDQPAHGHDLFSEVIGRLPLLLEPGYAQALEALGQAWALATTPAAVALLRRFTRATFELGLLAPAGERPQFYGATLLTSPRHLHAVVAAEAASLLPLAGAARQLRLLASPVAGLSPEGGSVSAPTYFVAQDWAQLLAEVQQLSAELAQAQRPAPGPHTLPALPLEAASRANSFAQRTAERQVG
jgi:phenylalanine-4-hydroxylase